MRPLLAAAVIAALASVPSTGGSEGLRPAIVVRRRPTSHDVAVAVRTFQFAPDTVRVRVHSRVVWTNHDEIEHTITSGAPDAKERHFHGVVATRGATYSTALQKPGTYRYFCDRHRFMNGTIIVSH